MFVTFFFQHFQIQSNHLNVKTQKTEIEQNREQFIYFMWMFDIDAEAEFF